MTEECTICYERVAGDQVFRPRCCIGKVICVSCLRRLLTPRCPYCRSMIPEIQDRFQSSQSFIEVNHHLIEEQAIFMADHGLVDDTLDPRLIDSRILRRRIRRLWRRFIHRRFSTVDWIIVFLWKNWNWVKDSTWS